MFRFTIRDVLWLTVAVGMGAAWWLHSHAKDRQVREAVQRLLSDYQMGRDREKASPAEN